MASYYPMVKNSAQRIVFPIYDNDGDLVSSAAGLDSEYSLDGGNFGDCTNEATEIQSSGIYYLDLQAGETNGDVVCIIVKTTTENAKTTVLVFYTSAQSLDTVDSNVDAVKAKTDNLPASPAPASEYDTEMAHLDADVSSRAPEAGGNVADILADTNELQGLIADSKMPAQVKGVDDIDLSATMKTSVNAEVDTALSDIDLDHIAKTTYGASKPAVGSLMDKIMNKDGSQTHDPTTDSLEAIRDNQAGADASAIADAVWNEAIADHTTGTTFGGKNQKGVPSETIGDYKADVSNLDVAVSTRAPASEYDTEMARIDQDLSTTESNITTAITNAHSTTDGKIDAVQSDVTAIKAVTDTLTLAAIADAVWDEANSGHVAAGSVGLALSNLLKIGKNKWAYTGTTFTIYDDNGSTPLYTFTLDSAEAPTSRTPA